jgi:hypothetical protein
MATQRDFQGLYDRIAALRNTVASRLASDLITNPQLADALTKQIDGMLQSVVDADARAPHPSRPRRQQARLRAAAMRRGWRRSPVAPSGPGPAR